MLSHPRLILLQLTLLLALSLSACASARGAEAPPTLLGPSPTPALASSAVETPASSAVETPASSAVETPASSAVETPPTPTPPPMAASVNGEGITVAEFEAEVERYRLAQQARGIEVSVEQAGTIVLEDLIAQVLLAQGARRAGFEADDELVEERIASLSAQIGGPEALTAWQSAHGYSDETFRLALRRAIEAAWMRDQIIASVSVMDEQVHVQQILLYNQEEAISVLAQLEADEDFETLAALYDPVTRGDLGWFPRGYLLEPEIEAAAFALQPGQYSEVIETGVGYHIIKVIERSSEHPLSPDALLALQEQALTEWLRQQRAQSEVVLAP